MADETIRERLEEQPIRDKFQDVTSDIPEGPMGKVGGGNLIGAAGFVAVESTKPVWQFIPGLKQPGYKITSHGTRKVNPGVERHLLDVVSLSEDVAIFAAKYTASPSNIDFIRSKTELVDIEEMTERGTYSTYRVTVDIETEGAD